MNPILRGVLGLPLRAISALALRHLGTITEVRTSEPVVALTFDDGPDPASTPRLLDSLARHGARATFFMVGVAAARYPEIVRRAVQEGHAVANHSWDHPSFRLAPGRERRRQLSACAKALEPGAARLFRPPYGHQSVGSRLDAWWLGYQVVTWTAQAIDWLDHDADRLLSPLIDRIKPGSIVLFHDAIFQPPPDPAFRNRQPTLQAVDTLLGRLQGRFRFVTIPELLQYGPAVTQHWYWKPRPDMLDRLRQHPAVSSWRA